MYYGACRGQRRCVLGLEPEYANHVVIHRVPVGCLVFCVAQCGGKLGSWSWHGLRCSCGQWQAPAFQVGGLVRTSLLDPLLLRGAWVGHVPPDCVIGLNDIRAFEGRKRVSHSQAGRLRVRRAELLKARRVSGSPSGDGTVSPSVSFTSHSTGVQAWRPAHVIVESA